MYDILFAYVEMGAAVPVMGLGVTGASGEEEVRIAAGATFV